MREWLTVIIACLIIGVLLDGLRRMRNAKRGEVRLSPKVNKKTHNTNRKDEPAVYGSELPNGGARVIATRTAGAEPAAASKSALEKRSPASAKTSESTPKTSAAAKPLVKKPARQVELDLDQHVPLLMDVDDNPLAEMLAVDHLHGGRIEPSFDPIDASSVNDAGLGEPDREHRVENDTVDSTSDLDTTAIDDDAYDRVLFSGRAEPAKDEIDTEPQAPEEVFVVNVMAPKGEIFFGDEIKDAILGAGLRFGSRKVFHKHEDDAGEGAIQFSLVNMVQPGVFDLHKMDQVETPGLSLFMTLPSEAESIPAYEAMVKAARFLAEQLGGELRDEQRSTLTPQTIEHNRARVSEYERRRQIEKARV